MTDTLESEISAVISRFHRGEQGHEPGRVEAFIQGDMVVVRCRDVFTPTEQDLALTAEGKKLIQSARRDQRALSRREIEAEVARVIGLAVIRSYYDIDTRIGEQVEVYVLERPLL